MDEVPVIWMIFALLGGFAVLVFLRTLALHLQQTLENYDTVREAMRLRREYEQELRRRQNLQDGDDGIIEV